MKTRRNLLIALPLLSLGVNAQRTRGSDTALPVTRQTTERFMNQYPDTRVIVTGGGIGIGTSAPVDNTTDITTVSRPVKFNEKMKAKEAGQEVDEVVAVYSALAVVIRPSNPVKQFTRQQLEDTFRGKITNWKRVDGNDRKIIVYSREASSGTYEFFKENVLKSRSYMAGNLSMPAMSTTIQSVSQTKGAIGYVGLACASPRTRTLSVSYNGSHYATLTVENAANKTYPIVRPLYYHYSVKNKEQVVPLINLILSPEGQEIIEKSGYTPVEQKKCPAFVVCKQSQRFSVITDIKNEDIGDKKSLNFIEQVVEKDLKGGKSGGRVQTRSSPEPNGYLRIGHAKAICLDFDIVARHGGVCNPRFDDINPTKEDVEYVEAIKEDIQWLDCQWGNECYASDYSQQLWDFVIRLTEEGRAYIDEQTTEQIAQQEGTPTQAGVNSPHYDRPVEGSLGLFKKMNSGKIEESAMVPHAKIDMANPNMRSCDPIIYRVTGHPHHHTGTTWKAYLIYDFAHEQSSFFEGITHSLYTFEFMICHPFYDFFIDWLGEGKGSNDNRPRQTESSKLNLSYTLMGKHNLLTPAEEGLVNGWDDPRMPATCSFHHCGYSPESIHKFINKIGYTTYDTLSGIALLESSVRGDLNSRTTRVSAVVNPVKLIITNYPEGQVEELEVINNSEDSEAGSRMVEFSHELWMERENSMEGASKKYFHVTPEQEVRLKNAYIVKCIGCKKDENGATTEVYCEYDANTRSSMPDTNRRAKGTLHWVSYNHYLRAEVRLYDRLWKVENPYSELAVIREVEDCEALEAMKEVVNPDSLKVPSNYYIEKFAATLPVLSYLQFQRIGYLNIDKDSTPEKLVFSRAVGLKNIWGKVNK